MYFHKDHSSTTLWCDSLKLHHPRKCMTLPRTHAYIIAYNRHENLNSAWNNCIIAVIIRCVGREAGTRHNACLRTDSIAFDDAIIVLALFEMLLYKGIARLCFYYAFCYTIFTLSCSEILSWCHQSYTFYLCKKYTNFFKNQFQRFVSGFHYNVYLVSGHLKFNICVMCDLAFI